MPHRIAVTSNIIDARAEVRKKQLNSLDLTGKVTNVSLSDVYTIDRNLGSQQLTRVAQLLSDPSTQTASVNRSQSLSKFSWAVEVGFLPGVTDNVGSTARESIEDLLGMKFKNEQAVYWSQVTFISGRLNQPMVRKLARSLYNPLIQRATIRRYAQWKKEKGVATAVPRVQLEAQAGVKKVDLNISDQELVKLGKQGIANLDGTRRGPLALSLSYLKTIRSYFSKLKRQPTDIELESIAQTWSEHCKHTIFADPMDQLQAGLYKTYIKKATQIIRKKRGSKDICVSVFTDNSGAIEFDDDYLISHKVETHNSPSALDPFGGAVTGIVGVNRDCLGFGLGAKPVLNTYGFCLSDPSDKTVLYKGKNKTQQMLTSRRIMDGVIAGVNNGGNCSGIPTPQGFIYFDEHFRGKPLVFVGTVGLIPRKIGRKAAHKKKALPRDYIVMIGGRVGQDGIHGATFSSEAMDSGSPVGAVQIGDPITQKKLADVVVKEARDLGLFHSITDNGAGGLSCSVAEMARECGGFEVQLEKVPLKYPGLAPWQIWTSESQERMTLAVAPQKWSAFSKLMKKRAVEATVIGRFTRSSKCLVKYQGRKIMDLEMDFLHDGLPVEPQKTTFTQKFHPKSSFSQKSNLTPVLKTMLRTRNIAGFEFISQQYDHEVQGTSVLKPLQGKGRINSPATVIRPVLSSKKGVVVSQGLYPNYGQIDPYHMASCAIDTAIRNAIAVGATLDHLALLDNFCWCSSDEPERLGQLKRAAQACFDYATTYGTPFISGKDSMYNDFKGFDQNGQPLKISILPTLLISSIGVIKNIDKVASIDFKFPGDLIYVLGETFEEVGGSEYLKMNGFVGNQVPKVNARKNKLIYKKLAKAISKNLVSSSISVERGGLAVALTKAAMAGDLGLLVSLENLPGKFERADFALFSESQGRLVVTINPLLKSQFEQVMSNTIFCQIGEVTQQGKVVIKNKHGRKLVDLRVKTARSAYKSTFKNY